MKENNKENYLMNKLEFVKNPVIAEFLGYSFDTTFTETELETSIINNLQKFLILQIWKLVTLIMYQTDKRVCRMGDD